MEEGPQPGAIVGQGDWQAHMVPGLWHEEHKVHFNALPVVGDVG